MNEMFQLYEQNKIIILKAMKKILIFAVLFIILLGYLLFAPLFGHPVWGEKIILTQPNGIKIVGYIYGDEFHHRIETKEGYTIILNDQTGTIEYAILENNKLVPSGMGVGLVRASYLERISFPKHLTDRKFRIAEIREKSPEKFHDRLQRRPKTRGLKIQALEGTKKVFVVCVEFQPEDSPPTEWYSGTYSPSGFDERLFSTDPLDISMTNYYKSNSYNKFWPEGYTYPNWVTLPQTASWYKEKGSWRQIITDALDGIRNINPSFDFTQYANNGDMDVILVWAGCRETWSSFYWPHMSRTWIIRYGVRVRNYNAVNEKKSDGSEAMDIGVFCHEYGHMTGSPDLYDYSSFQLMPVGYYCVMSVGAYTTNFCGYLKWKVYGWITPEEVFSSGTYNLDALGLTSASNPRLYKINIESPEEFLLLENRHNGSDPDYENLSGRRSGLLITHIDENYFDENSFLWAEGQPDYTFYGVEAIVPCLDPSITTLEEYAAYYDEMVFASDYGFTRLEPAYPDDQPAGAYLTLTSGDDTENVIYRNTQGHTKSTSIYLDDISSSQNTMSFTATVPLMSPAISGSVKTPAGQGIEGVTLSFSDGGGETTTDANGKYVHDVSLGWSGTVTPSKTDYIFDPPSQSYSNVTSSQIDQDYFASSSLLKGKVTNSVDAGIEDVQVRVYSSSGSYVDYDFTDSNGDYIIGSLETGDYKLRFDTYLASGMYGTEYYNDKDSKDTADLVSVTEGNTTSGIDAVLAEGGSIAGRVTNVVGVGIEDVGVYAYTPSGGYVTFDYTDSNGDYEIRSLKPGSYKLEFYAEYALGDYISEWYNDKDSFGTSDSVSVTEWSVTSGIDAELSSENPIISGVVKTSGDIGIEGVTITFSDEGDTVTDSDGNYFHAVSNGWSGTATPSKEGYAFSPPSRDYDSVTSDMLDEDYIATIITTVTISGSVKTSGGEGVEGVMITFSNEGGSTTTDSDGDYSHSVSYGWSGTATPSKTGYAFSPTSRDYPAVTSNQTDQDYTASLQTHTISGKVSTSGTLGEMAIVEGSRGMVESESSRGRQTDKVNRALSSGWMSTQSGLSGVIMNGLPGSPMTDASGNYSASVEYGWSGIVTPSKAGYSFSPLSRAYSDMTSDLANQDYTGLAADPASSWIRRGPYGGDINCLAISHTNPDIIYAATEKGMYKTVDGGSSWTKAGLSETEALVIQVDPSDPDIVYVGYLYGIYKSEDGGNTWTRKGESEQYVSNVKTIAIDSTTPNILYAGTKYWSEEDQNEIICILKSTDGGETWDIIKSWEGWGVCGWDKVNFILVDPDNSSNIFAGGENSRYCPEFGGFLKSTDGGETWVDKALEPSDSFDIINSLAKGPNSQVIYAFGGAGGPAPNDLYKSPDRGDNWVKVDCPYSLAEGALAVDPLHPERVYIGTNEDETPLAVYDGNEDEWSSGGEGLLPQTPSCIVINSQNSDILYLGFYNGGIYKSADGALNWNESNQGINNVYINALAVHPASSETVFMSGSGFGYSMAKTANQGTSWDYLPDSPGNISTISLFYQNPLNIFVGKGFQGSCGVYSYKEFFIYKSMDDGQNWTEIMYATCTGDCCATEVSEILIKENNSDFILLGTTPIWAMGRMGIGMVARTTDGGVNWEEVTGSSTALAFDPNNPDIVYSGKERIGQAFKLTDVWGDCTGEEITPVDGIGGVRDIVVDMNSHVYFATSGGLMKWDGSDWTKLNGLPTDDIYTLEIDRTTSPETLYAGTGDHGVYVSQDGGSNWTPFNEGLGNLDVIELAISKTAPKVLYAGTAYGGTWSRSIVGMYRLTIAAGAGGTTNPIPGTHSYAGGAEASVEAIPDTGYRFSYWSGDVPFGDENDNPLRITMDSDKSVAAHFSSLITPPTISGSVKTSGGEGVGGVTITFSNGGGSTTTDSSGNYSHGVSSGWSGTATPSKTGYTFSPASRDYDDVTSDKTGQNYTATLLTYTISGNVSLAGGSSSRKIQASAGLSGVMMDGLPGDPTTDASGDYSGTVAYGWSGTVTPTKAGYSFSPSSKTYPDVTSDQLNQDYTASIIQCTLTIDAETGGTTDPAPADYTYDYGAQVSVRAIPDSGYEFEGWSGDASGTENPITITMDSDKYIKANFREIPPEGEGDGGEGAKKGCFIATAAYGSPLHPHLDILRDFRDKYLIPNKSGRKLVELYYRYSPSIANFIANHKVLKVAVRINLLPIIIFSYSMVNFGPFASAVMLVFMLVLPIFFSWFYPSRRSKKY